MPDTWERQMNDPGNVPVVKETETRLSTSPYLKEQLQTVIRTLENKVL